jgi:hypothetical protein
VNQYIIPVAFEVTAETEEAAARLVVDRLSRAAIVVGGDDPRIESWSTPNHAFADGSTDEGDRLVWRNE